MDPRSLIPIEYEEPVFRPPGEAYALIFQATIGCSWNRCLFCEMYSTKKFRVRSEEEILADVDRVVEKFDRLDEFRRVFLADGDVLVLSTQKLLSLLGGIRRRLPRVRRISAYASPRNLLRKTAEELTELKEAGLMLVYVGIESGDDEILKRINKGETFRSTSEGLLRAREAGLKTHVMIINGLGGRRYSKRHATESARLLNLTQPEFASLLTLMFPLGEQKFRLGFGVDFEPLDTVGLLRELRLFLESTELESTVFRTDHASNYLVLKGVLDKDRDQLLAAIDEVLKRPAEAPLRPEWQRGL